MAQPPPSRLTLTGLLTLPYRLCNPPPAVGKVRSCSLTPVLEVRLEDVLERKHLPPLGLKDFEEYLLYVEQAPENLYFILWLNEYTARYHAWAQRAKAALLANNTLKVGNVPGSPRRLLRTPPAPDPGLAMFYLRAKQTFFTPYADYELDIPSDILGPFHCPPHGPAFHARTGSSSAQPPALWHSQSAHPDPAVFTEVVLEARAMLNASLRRFARAAYTNVGSGRASCGIAGGCFFILVTGVLPLTMTAGRWNKGPHGRFVPLVAFPGLWLGLTILIASFQGICLMIYVFGDLRQLRKFELARPSISGPMAAEPASGPLLPTRSPTVGVPRVAITRDPLSEKEEDPIATSPVTLCSATSLTPHCPPFSQSSARTSVTSCASSDLQSGCSTDEPGQGIQVSAAVFDEEPAPEGPATATCFHRPEYRPPLPLPLPPPPPPAITFPSRSHSRARATMPLPAIRTDLRSSTESCEGESIYGPTAGFISEEYGKESNYGMDDHHGNGNGNGNGNVNGNGNGVGVGDGTWRRRSSYSFDFDLLPRTRRSTSVRGSRGRPGSDAVSTPPGNKPGKVAGEAEHGTPLSSPPTAPGPGLGLGLGPAVSSPTGTMLSTVMGRAQYKCNKRPSPVAVTPDSPMSASAPVSVPPPNTPHSAGVDVKTGGAVAVTVGVDDNDEAPPMPMSIPQGHGRRKGVSLAMFIPSFTAGVPAFAAPLTQVREPAVQRAQWQVVVWSGMIAFMIAGVVVGVVVGTLP